MRLVFVVSAAVGTLLLSSPPAAWAAKKKDASARDKEVVPDSISRQFQWEEKVVGPKTKGVDHTKIAAMQDQGRREDAAKKKEPQPRKATRAQGIAAPATATLPAMAIEQPAARKPIKRASYTTASAEPPRGRDAVDDLLAEESAPKSDSHAGLGNVLATSDHHTAARTPTRRKPHRRRN